MGFLYTSAVIKSVTDESKRIIYAKISDSVLDRDGEIIRLSAWRDGDLKNFIERSGALLLSHSYKELPIGSIQKFDKTSDGLFMEAKIIKGTAAADEAWAVIQQIGKIGFSVGFKPRRAEEIPVQKLEPREKDSAINAGFGLRDRIKVYTDVELLEVSLVSVPSLPSATLLAYKSGKLKNSMLKWACKVVCDDTGCCVISQQNIMKDIADLKRGVEKERISINISRAVREGIKEAFLDEQVEKRFNQLVMNSLNPKKIEPEMPSDEEIRDIIDKTLKNLLQPDNLKKTLDNSIKLLLLRHRGKMV